jgi:glyoxylase-like metal-dependent hydrolase (beta-lactamase superfamily II)
MLHALVSRQESSTVYTIAPGVAGLRTVMVNVFFIGERQGPWVLVDAGIYGSARSIRRAAEQRYGEGARPEAIVLTHGHFDHTGALRQLADAWDVPVYAHRLEHPYLTGRSEYPPPDPSVGGGLMAVLSPLYPRGPIDVSARLRVLDEGELPGFSEWRVIHTPGHTHGHVSLFRERDKTLIAGDAMVTTKPESLSAVVSQRVEVHGPPAYYTTDWDAARDSVRELAELQPFVIATGHGSPIAGKFAQDALREMAAAFDRVERPKRTRYSERPALAGIDGVISVPDRVGRSGLSRAAVFGAGVLVAAVAVAAIRRRTAH